MVLIRLYLYKDICYIQNTTSIGKVRAGENHKSRDLYIVYDVFSCNFQTKLCFLRRVLKIVNSTLF